MSDYYRPRSVSEAVTILADTPDATIIAGGTDLVIDRRLGRADPQAPLVDVTGIDELRGLRWDGDELHIGAAATIRQVECDPTVIARASALAEAARVLGSVQIRNMATLGGNLCNASPAAEMAPPLMAHDAVATVHGPDGTRRQPVAALATGPRTTSLKAGEILTSVRLRVPPHSGSCYVRQTVRWAMDLAGVGVAAWVLTDGDGAEATVKEARLALGAVSPTAVLVPGLDLLLAGHPLTAARLGAASAAAAAACQPISDTRGTAEHRRHVAGVLAVRALSIAHARASGLWPGGLAPVNGRASAGAPWPQLPPSHGVEEPAAASSGARA